ncbi:MAG: sulfatase-like hydrolase/transferase [Candidatus Cyclobacteriaceae bacterium M3_2C_046]
MTKLAIKHLIVLMILLISIGIYQTSAQKQPNIILIISDDQGWGDFGYNGNDLIETPNLNRLANQSAVFERYYVSSVCAPTRASLLTGRYYPRTGVHGVTRRKETMRAEEITIAEILQENGYRTGIFGKWHNGHNYPYDPIGQGFQEFWGFTSGIIRNYYDTKMKHNNQWVQTEGYITDFLTDKALQFIKEKNQQPFFCYIPYNVPHTPIQVSRTLMEKYISKGLDEYDAGIYAMCEAMDHNIGRLIAEVDQLGIRENTIILFMTDNGPNGYRFNGGMKGKKARLDEGGIRVPLWINWQNKIERKSILELADHIDVLPTLLDLCNVSLSDSLQLDGKSLKPLLLSHEIEWPERKLFSARHGDQPYPGSIRTNRYRLIIDREGGKKLYDMWQDPSQLHDIAEDEKEITQTMANSYDHWYKDVSKNGFQVPVVHIGHPEYPVVELPTVGAEIKGGLSYKNQYGYAYDWVINWTDTEDALCWPIKVVKDGLYKVYLKYATANIGNKITVSVGDKSLENNIKTAFSPQPYPNFDTVDRGRALEYEWKDFYWGKIRLKKGEYNMKVHASPDPGLEIYGLSVELDE